MTQIYFDNHSTTFMDPEVADEVHRFMKAGFANPASQHELGRRARLILEQFRESIAAHLGVENRDRCLFTSGGTESNNLALLGHFGGHCDSGWNIVSSSIEHPSVITTLGELEKRNIEIRWVDPEPSGCIDPDKFAQRMDKGTRLACCMLANNETGVIQPVSEIASKCLASGIPLHVDAVQAIGKVDFDFSTLGCASAAVSGHKIHGPVGAGLLLLSENCQISPMTFGGFQQEGIRPGTENIPAAAGLAQSIELAIRRFSDNRDKVSRLRDRFEQLLLDQLSIQIHGQGANRLYNSSNISFLGCNRQQFILAADVAGLCCSTGSACSSGSSQPSHVLTAMGCKKEWVDTAVRFGFSSLNTMDEVESAIQIICGILQNKKLAF